MIRRIRPISRILKIEAEIRRPGAGAFLRGTDLPGLDQVWVPAVDIYEKDDEIVVEVELAGVLKKDIRIMLHSNRIEVKGLKKEGPSEAAPRYHRLEREYGTFRRMIFIPCAVQPERTAATMENGILTIVLKKRPGPSPEVEVKIRKSGV
jgi:HSP20 family protein